MRDQRLEEAPFDEVLEYEVQVHLSLQDEEQGQELFRPIFHWTIPIDVWEKVQKDISEQKNEKHRMGNIEWET